MIGSLGHNVHSEILKRERRRLYRGHNGSDNEAEISIMETCLALPLFQIHTLSCLSFHRAWTTVFLECFNSGIHGLSYIAKHDFMRIR